MCGKQQRVRDVQLCREELRKMAKVLLDYVNRGEGSPARRRYHVSLGLSLTEHYGNS